MNIKVINIAISIVVLGVFVCCSTKDNDDVFNGEIRYIDDSGVITKNVESKPVPLDEGYMGTGMIAVYDSLLVCWNPGFPDHFFDVFNADTTIPQFFSPIGCINITIIRLHVIIISIRGLHIRFQKRKIGPVLHPVTNKITRTSIYHIYLRKTCHHLNKLRAIGFHHVP